MHRKIWHKEWVVHKQRIGVSIFRNEIQDKRYENPETENFGNIVQSRGIMFTHRGKFTRVTKLRLKSRTYWRRERSIKNEKFSGCLSLKQLFRILRGLTQNIVQLHPVTGSHQITHGFRLATCIGNSSHRKH